MKLKYSTKDFSISAMSKELNNYNAIDGSFKCSYDFFDYLIRAKNKINALFQMHVMN